MTKTITIPVAAFLLAGSMFQTGCSDRVKSGNSAKKDVAVAESALMKAGRSKNPRSRINYLRSAYDNARQLKADWPNAEEVLVFLEQNGDQLSRTPGQVYEFSMQTRDLDSFKWAISRSANGDLQYFEVLKIWQMGKDWRDYFISVYPEKALSIFMSEAVDEYSVSFFNQYIGEFKASGYRLEFPLEKTEFNARFCRFFAEMIQTAMEKQNSERIGFLLDHMPTYDSVIFIDPKTRATMKALGDYVFHELKDEALACKLIGLGYELNRIDVSKAGFGRDFAEALMTDLEHAVSKTDFNRDDHGELMADLEHAVIHVLKLNEWHGSLSEKETYFLITLPDPILRLIHKLHITEAIETSLKNKDTANALRLIKFSEETQPLTTHDYDQILVWSLEYKNRPVSDYVKTKCTQVDIYRINLAKLAENQALFLLHTPNILKKIYNTMDKNPRGDGTTLGRIDDLLRSHNPEAVLYVVKNYDFGDAWTEATTDGRTLLMAVCEGGNLEAAKYLIESKGADVHAQTDYVEAKTSVFGRFKSEEGRLRPIFFAAKSGNYELINYLVSKKADVNSRSGFEATPLMYAVSNNHLEATKTLISLGADVNKTMNNMNPSDLADAGGYRAISTAYNRALKNGNKEILDVLVKAGAKP